MGCHSGELMLTSCEGHDVDQTSLTGDFYGEFYRVAESNDPPWVYYVHFTTSLRVLQWTRAKFIPLRRMNVYALMRVMMLSR